MKRLLNIFNFFNITILSSLTIISCENKDTESSETSPTDEATNTADSETSPTDESINTADSETSPTDESINTANPEDIAIEADEEESEATQDPIQQKLDDAVTKLNAINKIIEIGKSELNSNGKNNIEAKIKNLPEYKDIFTQDIALKNNQLNLIHSNQQVENNTTVLTTVTGTVHIGEKEKDFAFIINIKQIAEPTSNIKFDLNTVKTLNKPSWINLNELKLYVDTKKTNNALDKQILAADLFKFKPLRNYRIEYYDALTGGKNIKTSLQKSGPIYIQIFATANDPYWRGQTTNRIKLDVIKTNLTTISDSKIVNNILIRKRVVTIKVNINQKYSMLNSKIIAKIRELVMKPLATGYQMTYHTRGTLFGYNTLDTNQNQNIGKIYVKIKASANDPNWEGQSSEIKINLIA